MEIPRLITILGPTATGKTKLAALLSVAVDGEVISADSRQVYKGMTIGTGKDIDDYIVDGMNVPFHIIDVVHPHEEFNVFRFKQLFIDSVKDIISRGKTPVLCGGTGLYLDAVLRDYWFVEVPENKELRAKLELMTVEALAKKLISMKKVHNKTDLIDKDRLIRSIEIQEYYAVAPSKGDPIQIGKSHVFGLMLPREEVRRRISDRLEKRVEEGMISEVNSLLESGISSERLISFGLEYKWVTLYVTGQITYQTMLKELCTAIQQFSKRQMTWFRRMDRMGIQITWIDGTLSQEDRVGVILQQL